MGAEEFQINAKKPMELGLFTLGDDVEHLVTGHKISEYQRMIELCQDGKKLAANT
jgi:hypothetical protein